MTNEDYIHEIPQDKGNGEELGPEFQATEEEDGADRQGEMNGIIYDLQRLPQPLSYEDITQIKEIINKSRRNQ